MIFCRENRESSTLEKVCIVRLRVVLSWWKHQSRVSFMSFSSRVLAMNSTIFTMPLSMKKVVLISFRIRLGKTSLMSYSEFWGMMNFTVVWSLNLSPKISSRSLETLSLFLVTMLMYHPVAESKYLERAVRCLRHR